MAKNEPDKRPLKFETFDQLYDEVQSLIDRGYDSNGNWNLAQSLIHVANWMRYPMDGFPTPPIFLRPAFWLMKVAVGRSMKRKILAEGFGGGVPTAPESVPAPDEASDQQAFDLLRSTIARVEAYTDELLPSPLFGPVDKATLQKITLLHAEHHLGYLSPKA